MLGSIIASLIIIFVLAFLVETLVEFLIGTPMEKFPALKPYKWMTMFVAIAVGIMGAFVYQFDVIYLIAGYLGVLTIPISPFGLIITGIAIGKGSNYIHDLVRKVTGAKDELSALDQRLKAVTR
jgi:hypothetical protein